MAAAAIALPRAPELPVMRTVDSRRELLAPLGEHWSGLIDRL
jgi:hypothetical protein